MGQFSVKISAPPGSVLSENQQIPGRLFRMLLIIITFGLLAGCSNSDPLAVASGPLFALNAGHWQPTPQDFASPPVVVDR